MCCSMHVELAKIGLNNNNIILPAWKIRDLLVKATIHRTDTVSVVIGCSPNQIALDINGIIRLTNALSVLEERLSRVIDETHVVKGVQDFSLIVGDSSSGAGCGNVSMGSNRFSRDRCKDTSIIPAHSEWTGGDASVEYSGEKFSVTWETAESTLVRAYSKMMNDHKTRIRLERQGYPKATLADIIEQRLSGEKGF